MKLRHLFMILFLLCHSLEAYSAQFSPLLKTSPKNDSLNNQPPKIEKRLCFPFSIFSTMHNYINRDVAIYGERHYGKLRYHAIILGSYDHQYNGTNPPLEILLNGKVFIDTTKDIESQLKHCGQSYSTDSLRTIYPKRHLRDETRQLPKGTICIRSTFLTGYKYRGELITLVIELYESGLDNCPEPILIRKKGESQFYPLPLTKDSIEKLFGPPEHIIISCPPYRL